MASRWRIWSAGKKPAKHSPTARELAPNDKRFPIELAGVAFKQKKYGEAKRDLHRALRLDPKTNMPMNFWRRFIFLKAIWKRRSSTGTA